MPLFAGHYMFIDPSSKPAYSSSSSSAAHPYRYARMSTPTLPPANQYCVRFWYTMLGSDIGTLQVYAQVSTQMLWTYAMLDLFKVMVTE